VNGVGAERVSWDCKIEPDMAMCGGVRFLFYCEDPGPRVGLRSIFAAVAGLVYDLKIYCHSWRLSVANTMGAVYLRLY